MTEFKYKNQKGFTLIELLIVVAIVGLLASTITAGFTSTRLRSRDARRLTDLSQIKSGLDLYYTSAGGYPSEATWATDILSCGPDVFLTLPEEPGTGANYHYIGDSPTTVCGGPGYRNYAIQITTEGPTDYGPPGTYYLSPAGITTVLPF